MLAFDSGVVVEVRIVVEVTLRSNIYKYSYSLHFVHCFQETRTHFFFAYVRQSAVDLHTHF